VWRRGSEIQGQQLSSRVYTGTVDIDDIRDAIKHGSGGMCTWKSLMLMVMTTVRWMGASEADTTLAEAMYETITG